MLAKITLYDGTVYKIASQTVDTEDGIYLGRIKDELSLVSAMQEAGNAPNTVSLTIINYDNFIPHNKDLWAAEVLLTNENNISWRGKINFCNFDADGNLYVTASEKTAHELELQLPDEVRQVYTVDEDFHQSSVTMTIPLVIGGTSSNPITLPTILIDKTRGIYLICVGEIRSVVKVYNGAEQLPQTAYTAYTGTADQEENAGFAYVQIAEDYRLNSDGSYAEINVDVVGLKLADFTEEECRNGALFLYYFLTTADTGVNGWGCGIDTDLIDTDSFQSAITLCNQLGYKLDGIMWLRQSAQSWIDQICQAIHGKYSINANGKRSLFIDYAGNASKKTFTASNMQVERYGKNSYTSVVYNKGVLSYDYNPITGLFMQSAQYENADSIAQIGEQKFIGESYLIKDATTALAVLEYTCKRSQIAAEAIEFKTDDVETNLRAGDIITINRPDLNLNNALYQIQSISTTDFISNIIAVKFDTSVFSVTGTATTVNWGNERDITPALTPAQATNLLLSTGFDINPDGTGTPYISGTFTVPDGGWLAAAVQYGIGASPSNWTELALITEGKFKLSPVNVGTVYSIRVRMITSTGHSDYITGQITATGDTIPPAEPTIVAKATDRTVTVQCGLDNPPYDMGGFQIYRKKSTEQVYTLIGSVAANRGYASITDYVDEYVTYNYLAKSYDRSGNLSTNFSNVASVTVTGIQANDVAATALSMPTGSILRLSAKNCTTASIAETNGVKDVSGNGNHGQAGGGVSIVTDEKEGDCYSFDRSSVTASRLTFGQNLKTTFGDGLTFLVRFKTTQIYSVQILFDCMSTSRVTLTVYDNLLGFSGGGVSDHITNTNINVDTWYSVALVFSSGKIDCYVDSVLVDSLNVSVDQTLIANLYVGNRFASSNIGLKGLMKDFRIYPRALTASEIKTIFMFPDDVTFGQLTSDLIGANVIKAQNLVLTENIITTNAQIKQAVIDNMTITGNANFIAEQQARAQVQTNLNTVTNNIYTPNTTTINGGKITTGTIQAEAIAANTITADKISVVARPTNCSVWLTAQGASSYANETIIPDLSGRGNAFTLYGTWNGINYSNENGVSWQGTTDNNRAIRNTKSITLPSTGWTIGLKFQKTGDASSGYNSLFDGWNGSDNKNRIYVRITGGKIQLRSWDSSGLESSFTSNLSVKNNKWYNIFVVCSSTTTIKIYLSENNSANYSLQAFTVGTRGGLTCSANGLCFANYYGVSGGYIFRGYVGYIQIFSQLKNESEIQYLMKTMADSQAGQITADRIATDAIRSRNYTSGSDGFSGAGTFLDLANGAITSKNFKIDSSGNATFKGTVNAVAGKIGNFDIGSNGEFNYQGSVYSDNPFIDFKSNIPTSSGVAAEIKMKIATFEAYSYTYSFGELTNTEYSSLSPRNLSIRATADDYYSMLWHGGVTIQNSYGYLITNLGYANSTYDKASLRIQPSSSTYYGLYVAGKARINSTDYGSDEKTKKDFQAVDALAKLKKLRVCAWRFDEEKLVEKENDWIDKENIKIEAENKAIDAENAEILKENEKRKNRKDGGEDVELIPLKVHKKLREHRIADKNANHPLNIGCMAGEFNKAFGTNDGSEDCLSVTDTIGVCMRAIQELAAEVDELKAKLKIQQDEKSDVEQEASYTEKPDNSKEANNADFPDVGKMVENQQEEQKK